MCVVCSALPRRKLFGSSRAIAYLIEEAYFALIALEEADSALGQLPPQPQTAPTAAGANGTGPTPPSAAAASPSSASSTAPPVLSSPSTEPAALTAEHHRLLMVRHQCLVALLDALDVLSLPPPTFPPDTALLRAHLLHLLYPLPKGRLLLFRSLTRLSPPHTFDLLFVLTANLSALCTPPQPSLHDEQLAITIADILYTMPHSTVNLTYAQLIMAPTSAPPPLPPLDADSPPLPPAVSSLVSVLRSKLGCMVVQVLVKKGQELHSMWMTQRPPSNTATPSTPLPPHLAQLSHDLSLWESLTGELLQRLDGHWPIALHGLSTHAHPQPTPSSSSSVSLLSSARAMWELLSQLLSHLTTPAPFAAMDPTSAAPAAASLPEDSQGPLPSAPSPQYGAGRDAALFHRLVTQLTPLFRAYITHAYIQPSPHGSSPPLQPSSSGQLSSPSPTSAAAGDGRSGGASAGPAGLQSSFASAAAAAGPPAGVAAPPSLLPALSPSLMFLASVLFSSSPSAAEDAQLLTRAQQAQRASEDAARAFIAQKRSIRQQQQQRTPHRHQHPQHHQLHQQQYQLHQRTHHSRQQTTAAASPPNHPRQQPPPFQPANAAASPVKSAPGSYAFIAANKAPSPALTNTTATTAATAIAGISGGGGGVKAALGSAEGGRGQSNGRR